MLAFYALLALSASPESLATPQEVIGAPVLFDPLMARGAHMGPTAREVSKKQQWLAEKARRPNLHLADNDLHRQPVRRAGSARRTARVPSVEELPQPGERVLPVVTLFNVWTKEALPLLPGDRVDGRFRRFLRDHYTNQATLIDLRLLDVLRQAAHRFSAERIEVVSGYRSPKYNLMLRKKGHQVAKQSQHVEGHAVDFRIRGIAIRQLVGFVKSLRLGGVGYYPHSQFVHADTGKIRFWKGS